MRTLSNNELVMVNGGQLPGSCEELLAEIYRQIDHFYAIGCPQIDPGGCGLYGWQIQQLIDTYSYYCS